MTDWRLQVGAYWWINETGTLGLVLWLQFALEKPFFRPLAALRNYLNTYRSINHVVALQYIF